PCRPAGGRFGPPVDVSVRSPIYRTFDAHVALAGNGDAAVVWSQDAPIPGVADRTTRVVMAALGHRGSWQAPAQLSAPPALDQGVDAQTVAIDARGDAAAAWREVSLTRPFQSVIKASIRPSGGAFGPASPLSGEGQQPGIAAGPELASDARGNVIAIWSHQVAAHTLVTEAAR